MAEAKPSQHEFKIGDRCEVFSHGNKKWFQAEILEEVTTKRGKELKVQYRVGDHYMSKRLSSKSEDLREIDISNNTEDVKCICGEAMIWMFASNCYPKQQEEAVKEEKDEEDEKLDIEPTKDSQGVLISNYDINNDADKSTVGCDLCGRTFANDEQLFHCPKGCCSTHNTGSDLCYKCAKYEPNDEEIIQNVTHEDVTDDPIASSVSDEPFAEGSSRYAYLALWRTGKKKGTRCVIKKYKDKHLFDGGGFDGDVKCCKLAAELVAKWNELKLINKKYEIIVPIIARKNGGVWELQLVLLLLLSIVDESSESLEDLKEMLDTSAAGKNVKNGEVVLIEDYLRGDFLKWNSNSGWMGDEKTTVQAFCHWTYHYSNGDYLFCDAQGVKRADKYILTDPAILSNTDKGGVYGVADCGRRYLLNWFRQHKCNQFCDSKWNKPSQIELDSVPQIVRKTITRNTTFNQTRIMRSQRLLSSGSVMASGIEEKASSNIVQSHSVNKYENEKWQKYDRYLSVHNGERIILCTAVTRIKTFGNQNLVLLLSSFEKLYMLDPRKNRVVEEYAKRQVVKVEVKRNNKLILYLLNNAIHFTVQGIEYDANSWKQLIDSNMGCQ